MNSALIHTSLLAQPPRHVYTPQTSCALISLQCHPELLPWRPHPPTRGPLPWSANAHPGNILGKAASLVTNGEMQFNFLLPQIWHLCWQVTTTGTDTSALRAQLLSRFPRSRNPWRRGGVPSRSCGALSQLHT